MAWTMTTAVLAALCALVVAPAACAGMQISVMYPAANLPAGSHLELVGSACGLAWDSGVRLRVSGEDAWGTALASCRAGLQAKVIIVQADGGIVWMIGANAVALDDAALAIYPWFFTGEGTTGYATKELYSPQLNNTRPIIMYLPPSYFENPHKRYTDLLIMHDGQNLFDPNTAFMNNAWMAQHGLDANIFAGTSREVVVAGVWNTADRNDEYTYSYDPTEGFGGKGDLYLDFLEDTVLPFLSASFPRLSVRRGSVGILGSSLGGLISCYALWTRSDVYNAAGCMSTSFWWNSEDFRTTILATKPRPRNATFYLDSGDQPAPAGDDEVQTVSVRDKMEASFGFVLNSTLFYFLDKGAAHSETYWGPRFHIPLADLYPPLGLA